MNIIELNANKQKKHTKKNGVQQLVAARKRESAAEDCGRKAPQVVGGARGRVIVWVTSYHHLPPLPTFRFALPCFCFYHSYESGWRLWLRGIDNNLTFSSLSPSDKTHVACGG